MKIFQNKKLFKKLMIIFLIILIFSFCVPKGVRAEDGIGGKLLNPIMSFFVGLGDGIMAILHSIIFHSDNALIHIDTSASIWSKVIVIVAAVVLVAISIAACVITGGGAAAVALGVIKIVLVSGAITTITFPITTSLVEGMLPDSMYLPLYSITPQEIFSNKIPLLDVDFFNPTDSIDLEDGTTMESTAYQLRDTVANWYLILRDIAVVALLSILVYVGIRIIISTTSSDKAKYKQLLVDWVVAVCLLFIMHYIMSFSNMLVEKIINIVDSTQINVKEKDTDVKEPEMFEITDSDFVDKAYETLVEKPAENGDISSEEDSPYYSFFLDDSGNTAGSDSTRLLWPAENFVQQARIKLQLLDDDEETFVSIGWKMIYVILVVDTLIFIVTYLKRLIYMTFLTIIAPLVAMTYPIDKMNDGKAQAFNMWFKEYIFNLLIQPMHLILYTILVTSAMNFASQNLLYVIVALNFMIPAEKLLRKFFGFEKAQTPGLLGGPAGAALMMTGMNKLFKGPKPGKIGPGGKSGSSEDKDDNDAGKKPRMNWDGKEDAMIGSGIEDNGSKAFGEETNESETGEGLTGKDLAKELGKKAIVKGGETISNAGEATLEMGKNAAEAAAQQALMGDQNSQTPQEGQNNQNTVRLQEDSQKNRNKKQSKVRRVLRATKSGLGTAMRYYGSKLKKPETWIAGAKKFEGGAIKAATTILGTGTGFFLGEADGEGLGKTLQYAATGAIGGWTAGKNLSSIEIKPINEDLKEQANRDLYGDEFDEVIHEQNKKRFLRDDKNILKLENRYGKDAKRIMKEVVPDYFDMGLGNMDDIIAAYELEKTNVVENRSMAGATAKYAARIGSDTTSMNDPEKDKWKNTFASEFEKNGRVKDSKEADAIAKKTMERIDKFNKLKKG